LGQLLLELGAGLGSASFPASQGAWVNTKLEGELVLANTQGATQLDDSFPEVVASIQKRRVPKKLNDLRDNVKSWGRASFLPISHRVRVNAELLGHFLLQEALVKALLAEVFSDGLQLPWIGWRKGP